MNTTLLFAELLIIGAETFLWILLLVFAVFGFNWVPLATIKDFQNIVTFVILASWYVLGIIFDRLADRFFRNFERNLRTIVFPNPPGSYQVIKAQLTEKSKYLDRQMQYVETRLRVARASALNFAITTPALAIFLLTTYSASGWGRVVACVIGLMLGMLFTILAAYSWNRLTRTEYGLLKAHFDSGKSDLPIDSSGQLGTDQAIIEEK